MKVSDPSGQQSSLNGRELIDESIASTEDPVVLFSLSWCSFCRAAKQLLNQAEVRYRLIELDQGEFLEPVRQRQVRERLQQITGSGTLPQLFIGGESLGGYTDMAAALRSGQFLQTLQRHTVASNLAPTNGSTPS